MTTITVTPDLIQCLGTLAERVEIRDQDGRLVGAYYPASDYVNPIDGSPLTEEEIHELSERPLENIQGRPLEDILRDLETRK